MGTPSRTGRPGWTRRLLGLGAGALLAFLALELVARSLFGVPCPEVWPQVVYEAHDRLGFQMIPGDRHFTYQHEVRVNGHGLRGPTIGPRAEGVTRLWLLGDSMTFGHGLPESETPAAHLARELARRFPGREFEILNGGVQGYSTGQELAQLEEYGEEFEPDLVVLQWLWNDIWETDIEASAAALRLRRAEEPDPRPGRPWHLVLAWHGRQVLRSSALLMFLNDATKKGFLPKEHVVENAFERLGGQLDTFRATTETLGAKAAVLVLPDQANLLGRTHAHELSQRALRKARERDLLTIDPYEELRKTALQLGRPPTLPFDGHYDGQGNAAIARALAAELAPLFE